MGKRNGYTQGLFSGALSEWLSHCPSQPFQPLLSHRLCSSLREVQYFPAVPWGMKDTEQRTRILPRNQGLGIFLWHIDSAFLFMSFSLLNQNYLLWPHRSSVSLWWLLQISSFPFYPPLTKKILKTPMFFTHNTNTHTKWSYFCALWRGKNNPLKSSVYSLLLVLHILWVLTKCTMIIYPPLLKYHRE